MPHGAVVDSALILLRISLGTVFLAHGCNHIVGGGKISGTAQWFEGLGMRPGILHAWTASVTEVGSGLLLVLGFLTPLACAGVIGTMTVALVTAHLRNGFFIFRPGQGYEYTLTLIVMALALAGMGSGRWSLDHAFGWFGTSSWSGPVIAAIAGLGGSAVLLSMFWRPVKNENP